MAELINRDHAAQAIEAYLCSQCDRNGERDCVSCPHLDGDEILKSVQSVNHWIPVEDALPENSHPVLITWVNNYPVMSCYEKDKGKPFTGCAHYCNGKWYWYSQFSDDILSEYGEYQETVDVDVIAWMPMPDAYEPPEKE